MQTSPNTQALQRPEEKDTKHEDLRELLNAEPFGAFPSGFASVARLQEGGRETAVRGWRGSQWNVFMKGKHVLLTGLSSPSSTSSFVNSLRQSFRVTSPALFCEDTESRRNKDTDTYNW